MTRKIISLGILVVAMAIVYLSLAMDNDGYPVGIVVPHHDLVAPARQAYLAKISASYQPKTIVLVSPDHFNQNKTPITTTNINWQTTYGELVADQTLIELLQLPQSDISFAHEHGITTLLRDIKQYFPNTKIVPVMIGRMATYAEVNYFTQNLYRNCPDCLFVASVDFSHSQATLLADIHDKLTLRGLQLADSVSLYKQAEVDSPETLTALANWGNLHNKKFFRLFSHTNSGLIANINVGEITSHIIGGYYQTGDKTSTPLEEITLLMGGDTMFARGVVTQYDTNPEISLFTQLGERFFWGVDMALLNLEGVFSGDINHAVGWDELPPRLRFDVKFANFLKQSRISAVALANNHTYDGEEVEANFTKDALAGINIDTVGYPRSTSSVKLLEEGKTRVAVVAIATHESNDNLTESVSYYSKLGYLTVVYVHFGQEYFNTPTDSQQVIARSLIDAGADLVVGSHPHVFQTVDTYRGVPIIYSLGNFLFDQAFAVETQIGAVLGATISQSGVQVFLLPVKSYLATEIIDEPDYSRLVGEWTKPWSQYKTENNQFYFPITK